MKNRKRRQTYNSTQLIVNTPVHQLPAAADTAIDQGNWLCLNSNCSQIFLLIFQRFSFLMSSSDKQPGEVGGDHPVEGAGGAGAGAAAQDPKNVAELTNYIQSMLQQMQDRFFLRFK